LPYTSEYDDFLVSQDPKTAPPHFSAFDTRISTPVGTCNGTPDGTLMEKSICEIQVKRRCYGQLQEMWSWVSVIFVVKSFGLGSIIGMQGGVSDKCN
jgi:hypothetical protein